MNYVSIMNILKNFKMKKLFAQNPWEEFDMFKKNMNMHKKNIKNIFNKNFNFKYNFLLAFFIALVFLIIWLSTGFYVVQPEEQAVELIFGKYRRTSLPGLHYNFPSPIGKSFKIPVTYVNREEIGLTKYNVNQDNKNRKSKNYERETENNEVLMITQDENMISIQCEVQWRVNNAYDYLFNVRDRKNGETISNAAESVIREVVGQKTLEYLIEGSGREYIAVTSREILQKIVDSYKMGVAIMSVQMKRVDPPIKVINSFRDVQSARADMERMVNEADAYRNSLIPRAKSEAEKIIKSAEGYKIDLINRTNGNIQRLLDIYEEYKQEKAMTKQRIYLDTMGKILRDNRKIIIENENNISVLQMNELFNKMSN